MVDVSVYSLSMSRALKARIFQQILSPHAPEFQRNGTEWHGIELDIMFKWFTSLFAVKFKDKHLKNSLHLKIPAENSFKHSFKLRDAVYFHLFHSLLGAPAKTFMAL